MEIVKKTLETIKLRQQKAVQDKESEQAKMDIVKQTLANIKAR